MNWIEKVAYLIERKYKKRALKDTSDNFFYDVSPGENAWTQDELEKLNRDYPWLPVSYIPFIKKYDSLGLAWVTFYGSEGGDVIPLLKEIDYWRSEGLPSDYFPFGKGPSGEVYVFNHAGEVIKFAGDDYEFQTPQKIANSLEEFVGECLLGKRYEEFNFIEKDRFYDFLKSEQWA